MSNSRNSTLSGSLLIAAGCVFFVAAVVGGIFAAQPVFYSFFGVGAAFIAIGAVVLRKAKAP